MGPELEAMTSRAVYRTLAAYLDELPRRVQVPLPHPAVRH